jgi:N-acetylmuramoyl-L-alanine amidase
MGLQFQGGLGKGCGWLGAVAWVGLCCGGLAASTPKMRAEIRVQTRVKVLAWDRAVEARERFEAEAAKTHTRVEYARVMDGFRAIYHADPGAAHAARAVIQVAELLAEEGREFGDVKALRDAAGQYEFVAKAYPGGTLAPEALVQALDLLGPDAADDAVEARKVRVLIAREYPRYVRGVKAGAGSASETAVVRSPAPAAPVVRADAPVVRSEAPVVREEAAATDPDVDTAAKMVPVVAERVPAGGPAMVTGIRHWSTASYTRVAIDLNVDSTGDVKYKAVRVENPDRIFFDVDHARLAPGLAGKSFTITDDGFLTKIRAAQFSDEVTRVVLDVHEVAEYSAFLLPNPYRLIIDIHGRGEGRGSKVQGAGGGVEAPDEVAPAGNAAPAVNAAPAANAAPASGAADGVAGPVVRGGGVEVSSLPPMPVTDGSAGFGLPARSADRAKAETVARPRVVISSKPTVAKPVPNTVMKSSSDTGTEVAAVSSQPGKVEATRRPTSQPIAERSSDDPDNANHYVPRSKRVAMGSGEGVAGSSGTSQKPAIPADGSVGGSVATSQSRDVGHPAPAVAGPAAPVAAAPPTADGQTSLMRALGLKIGRIVIDAGHGGHDSGTLGVGGIEEKDVVLDVALRLGKLLHDRLGAEIVYTRADDTFIPLETRTAIANKAQADLFISVHANSSQDASARGVEVYYLNFTSDPEAMTVASRENAVSSESVHELSDLVKKIAMKDKIEESKELASDVDSSLYGGLRKGNAGLKDRGVKKAPFVVLIGANMPSILAEISFVTNGEDAAQLEMPEYRERVAESLYKGVARYAAAINGQAPREMKSKVRATEQAER